MCKSTRVIESVYVKIGLFRKVPSFLPSATAPPNASGPPPREESTLREPLRTSKPHKQKDCRQPPMSIKEFSGRNSMKWIFWPPCRTSGRTGRSPKKRKITLRRKLVSIEELRRKLLAGAKMTSKDAQSIILSRDIQCAMTNAPV